jgi:excisionase family DNA binding protein
MEKEKRPNHRPNKELKTTQKLQDSYYSIYEVADILKVHHNTIRKAIKENRIKGERIGYQWRIPKSEIDKK